MGFSFVAVLRGHCVVAQPKFNSHLNISVKMHPGPVVCVRMACVAHVGLVCSTDRYYICTDHKIIVDIPRIEIHV